MFVWRVDYPLVDFVGETEEVVSNADISKAFEFGDCENLKHMREEESELHISYTLGRGWWRWLDGGAFIYQPGDPGSIPGRCTTTRPHAPVPKGIKKEPHSETTRQETLIDIRQYWQLNVEYKKTNLSKWVIGRVENNRFCVGGYLRLELIKVQEPIGGKTRTRSLQDNLHNQKVAK